MTEKTAMLCTEEGCKEEAIYTYVWPWGTPGACCAQHSLTLNQKATQALAIEGGLHFVTIDPGRQAPVSRDERAQLRAGILVRDDEIAELKARIGDLTNNAAAVAASAQTYHGRVLALDADVLDLQHKLAQTVSERDAALATQADLIAENQRLKLILNSGALRDAAQPVSFPTEQPPAKSVPPVIR